MLLLWRALMALQGRLNEPVVFDHFEIFELTQDLPFGVGTPVGADSWFIYGVDPAPHSRTGRRSPVQERRLRRRARRPARGGYVGSTRRVLDRLLPAAPRRSRTPVGQRRTQLLPHSGQAASLRCRDPDRIPPQSPGEVPRARFARNEPRPATARCFPSICCTRCRVVRSRPTSGRRSPWGGGSARSWSGYTWPPCGEISSRVSPGAGTTALLRQ